MTLTCTCAAAPPSLLPHRALPSYDRPALTVRAHAYRPARPEMTISDSDLILIFLRSRAHEWDSTDTDMAPTKTPPKGAKKEKIFHPESRKAGQLARKQLRKSKLAGQASKRTKLHSTKGKSKFCHQVRVRWRGTLFLFFF